MVKLHVWAKHLKKIVELVLELRPFDGSLLIKKYGFLTGFHQPLL